MVRFEPLHNLNLGMTKLSKDFILKLTGPNRVVEQTCGYSDHRMSLR